MSPRPDVIRYESCPTPNTWGGVARSCKRRGCPYCGRPWAFDWERSMRVNLEHYGGPVMMIAITPPGKDVLPWACEKDHKHEGWRGCRVDDEAADRWAEQCRENWKRLREDARIATQRATGLLPTILLRVWEPQKRGVPHLHVVLGVATEAERIAARRFHAELMARSVRHGFGFTQRHVKESAGASAARYLVGYLLGRSTRKGSIRENIAHPRMPRSLIWLTPRLTRETLCNMRRLRYARWYLAARAGRCEKAPALRGQLLVDVAKVVTLVTRCFARNGPPDDEDEERELFLHMSALRSMRRLRHRWEWVGYRTAAA